MTDDFERFSQISNSHRSRSELRQQSDITSACTRTEEPAIPSGLPEKHADADTGRRVSYIITTKDRAEFLDHALANVREFIEPVDELIVIDGASTDDTAEVVKRYSDIVSLFVSEPDCGEGHALNKALWRARGRYIKGISDDDYFYPHAMRRLVAEMEADPNVDAIQCGGETWEIREGAPAFTGDRFLPEDAPATPSSIFHYAHSGLGIIIRRTALVKTGGVSGNIASVDGELICRLIELKCVIRYLDINLYRWYLRPHSGLRKPQIKEEFLWFSFRIRDRNQFVFETPQLAMLLCPSSTERRVDALFRWFWLVGRTQKTPLWWTSLVLYQLVRFFDRVAVACRHPVVSAKNLFCKNGPQLGELRAHEWSGKLR